MRARTRAKITAGGVLADLHCEPPLTLRRVHADPGVCELCLVGTAAGPLAGDDLELSVQVRRDADARLSATGASIAQGDDGTPARLAMAATVGEGARLRADPGPLVVCAGSRVDVSVSIDLAETGSVEWRELVVLGRTRDTQPGAATIRWDVTRAGRPVLRQFLDLTDPRLRSWPGLVGNARVIATVLRSGPDVEARTVVASPTAVTQRIDATTELTTVLAQSASEALKTLSGQLTREWSVVANHSTRN